MPSYVYNSEDLIEEWRGTIDCSDRFWDRMYREYLPSLRDRKVLSHKHGRSIVRREPQAGDIVHVFQEDAPKGSWPIGKILSLKDSRNGFVRTARVQVHNGAVLNRAVCHLYPLEIQSQDELVFEDLGQGRPG